MKPRIYIQIPAYRDSELQPTLYDMMQQAARPEQLRIGIAWQYDEGRERLDFSFIEKHKMEVIKIPASQSKGCNWARSLLQEKWNGEKYTLFLDSHHRFVPGWDEQVIDMYESLRSRSQKPILSAYLPVYDPFNDPSGRGHAPLKICFHERRKGMAFRLNSKEMKSPLNEPFAAHFTSLHFLFAEGAINKDIQFDPSIYFFADEIAVALRAYTKGYDLFHPHTILGWHLYDRATRVTHWADHAGWRKQMEASEERLFRLYRGYITGRFGVGLQRSVKNYEDYIGMSLIS